MKGGQHKSKDARARSTAEQTDDDHHPAHDRQLSGAGREEPSPGADGRGAPARRSGRSPVRSFASYGGGHGTARWRRPRNEAKRWASGKSRKTGFAKARATFRGGGRGSAAAAERHDSMMTKARWRGTEAIARETPAGSLSVASMPQRKDYTNDAEHHGKFQVWLQAGSFQGKARDGAAVRAEHAAPLGSHVWLSL